MESTADIHSRDDWPSGRVLVVSATATSKPYTACVSKSLRAVVRVTTVAPVAADVASAKRGAAEEMDAAGEGQHTEENLTAGAVAARPTMLGATAGATACDTVSPAVRPAPASLDDAYPSVTVVTPDAADVASVA